MNKSLLTDINELAILSRNFLVNSAGSWPQDRHTVCSEHLTYVLKAQQTTRIRSVWNASYIVTFKFSAVSSPMFLLRSSIVVWYDRAQPSYSALTIRKHGACLRKSVGVYDQEEEPFEMSAANWQSNWPETVFVCQLNQLREEVDVNGVFLFNSIERGRSNVQLFACLSN